MPGLVREMGIGGYTVDFNAQLLEFCVVIGKIPQFSRADEGKVGRVEKHNGPLAAQVVIGHFDKLSGMECGGFKRKHFGINQRFHHHSPWLMKGEIG